MKNFKNRIILMMIYARSSLNYSTKIDEFLSKTLADSTQF